MEKAYLALPSWLAVASSELSAVSAASTTQLECPVKVCKQWPVPTYKKDGSDEQRKGTLCNLLRLA